MWSTCQHNFCSSDKNVFFFLCLRYALGLLFSFFLGGDCYDKIFASFLALALLKHVTRWDEVMTLYMQSFLIE